MDWTTPIDLYCERVGVEFWAEPLNALSNLAFPLAAILGWLHARKYGGLSPGMVLLLGLAGCIGIGSFLFHTFANRWSELADVIPIWGFVASFVLIMVTRVGRVKPGKLAIITTVIGAVLTVVFLATSGETPPHLTETPTLLNGSGQYAPALLALLVFSWISQRRALPIAPWVIAATLAFALSLVFRSLDVHLCNVWPLGTHFLWHILNGVMIAMLLVALAHTPPNAPLKPAPDA